MFVYIILWINDFYPNLYILVLMFNRKWITQKSYSIKINTTFIGSYKNADSMKIPVYDGDKNYYFEKINRTLIIKFKTLMLVVYFYTLGKKLFI